MSYGDLLMGLAGEHLVCADLLTRGHTAFRTDHSCPYDVAVAVGERLIRVEVKTTSGVRPFPQKTSKHLTGYVWGVRHGKTSRSYGPREFDVLALVALDSIDA